MTEPSSVVHARLVQRPSARASLLHALGDLVHPSIEPVPTSAFLTVLSHAGYEVAASRQALARAADAGWITGGRRGRESRWALTASGHQLIEDGLVRIADLGRETVPWDHRWVVVMTSIPHGRRAVRADLYRYLSWSGFGSPMPGIWVSPFVYREHGARFAIDKFDLSGSTISFIGNAGSVGLPESAIVQRSWALDDLDSHYATLIARHAARDPQTGADVVRCLLDLDADLQPLPLLDPQLPTELVPRSTSRDAARALLARRADWIEPAREYWNLLATDGAARADQSA